MDEEIELSLERFTVILKCMRFLASSCAEFELVEKDHMPYMRLSTFALVESGKDRRVSAFLQHDRRNERFYYTENFNAH